MVNNMNFNMGEKIRILLQLNITASQVHHHRHSGSTMLMNTEPSYQRKLSQSPRLRISM